MIRSTALQIALRFVAVIGAASACGAQQLSTAAPPIPTVAVSGDADQISLHPATVTLRADAGAALLQVCLDVGVDTVAARATMASELLNAIAEQIAPVDMSTENTAHGLVLQVWRADDRNLNSDRVIDMSVPDIRKIAVEGSADRATQNSQYLLQAAERDRAPVVTAAKDRLVEALRATEVPPTATSDIVGCLNRANESAGSGDHSRRVVIVASTFPIASGGGTSVVQGSFDTTAAVLALSVGPNALERQEAWLPVWQQWGAGPNLRQVSFADGIRSDLALVIQGVLA